METVEELRESRGRLVELAEERQQKLWNAEETLQRIKEALESGMSDEKVVTKITMLMLAHDED